jgi:hypothetical protein
LKSHPARRDILADTAAVTVAAAMFVVPVIAEPTVPDP